MSNDHVHPAFSGMFGPMFAAPSKEENLAESNGNASLALIKAEAEILRISRQNDDLLTALKALVRSVGDIDPRAFLGRGAVIAESVKYARSVISEVEGQ